MTLPDPLRAQLPAEPFGRRLSAPEREQLLRAASDRNAGCDLQKLHHMMRWDVEEYERPHLPSVVGELRDRGAFSRQRGLRVLDLAIRMPGTAWAIPEAFAQFGEALRLAVEHERAINPDFDSLYYAYFTVDQKLVEPGKAQRRVGWHGDAFVSPETTRLEGDDRPPTVVDNTYVVFDALSTLFLPGPFSLRGIDSTDFVAVLRRFDALAEGREPLRYPPYTLLRMTPYDVHTPDLNTTSETIERTFVKIQFSRDRLNMMGNERNRVVGPVGRPVLSYDGWTWVARDPKRRNNRNSILGWDRSDRHQFRLVDPGSEIDFTADAPGAPWTGGRFFFARKVEGVCAEPAVADETLETVGGQGTFRSTFNIAQAGDWKIQTSQGDRYFLTDATFRLRYFTEGREGPGFYLPRGAPSRMAEITSPIRYRSPWGAWAYAPAGSVLARGGAQDVYSILPENFRASYVRSDERGRALVAGSQPLDEARAARPGRLLAVADDLPAFRGPYLAVFDLHGTLARPNWKLAMARVVQRLRGDLDEARALAWIERASYGASDGEVLDRVAAQRPGTSAADVTRLFREARLSVGRDVPLEGAAAAAEFVAALRERGIPRAVATFAHTPRARTLGQPGECGLGELVDERLVVTADLVPEATTAEAFRDASLRRLVASHPGAQLLFFNDAADGVATTRALGGIAIGVPQGEGADWEHRSLPLIAAGAHHLLQDWSTSGADLLVLIDRG